MTLPPLPDLKPCPHCGKSHTLKKITAQELAEEGEDDPPPWMHSDSWAVMCDASHPDGPGGCGASGGFFPSVLEAVEAWNRRAAIAAHVPEAAFGNIAAVPAQPVAWLGGDGHPHHINAMQTITERRIYGPWQPLYAAPQAVPVPAGWALVPVEATQEMCAAAVKFANGNAVYKNVAAEALRIEEAIYGEAYAAMLAAAPEGATP